MKKESTFGLGNETKCKVEKKGNGTTRKRKKKRTGFEAIGVKQQTITEVVSAIDCIIRAAAPA